MPSPAANHAPATDRNRDPILAVLRRVCVSPGCLLEIASGTGQHAAYFAAALPHLQFQTSDRDDSGFASVLAWSAEANAPNLLPPIVVDAAAPTWPIERAEYVFCANMIHIAPREAMLGLVAGAGRVLPPGGTLVLYGPYKVGGRHTADSNAAFDESLRARDPRWGVRDLEDLVRCANEHGFALVESITMPANNLTLVLKKGLER